MDKAKRDKREYCPCPENPKLRTTQPIKDQIIHIRKTYHFGPQRIAWYLGRYHEIKISPSGVRGVLLRNGLGLLPSSAKKRSPGPHFKLYEQQVPGHHVQMDVKILAFNKAGKKVKRFQYTAIDDATRVRAVNIYDRHTQKNAIDFTSYVIRKFPFRIKQIRTDFSRVPDSGEAYKLKDGDLLSHRVRSDCHGTMGVSLSGGLLSSDGTISQSAELSEGGSATYNITVPVSAH